MAEFSVPRAEPLEAGSLPLERDGCRISRSESHPYGVRHDRFPDRQWRACDLNTALQICHELNCE